MVTVTSKPASAPRPECCAPGVARRVATGPRRAVRSASSSATTAGSAPRTASRARARHRPGKFNMPYAFGRWANPGHAPRLPARRWQRLLALRPARPSDVQRLSTAQGEADPMAFARTSSAWTPTRSSTATRSWWASTSRTASTTRKQRRQWVAREPRRQVRRRRNLPPRQGQRSNGWLRRDVPREHAVAAAVGSPGRDPEARDGSALVRGQALT